MKKVANALSMLVILPIWYYLFYKILVAVNATELMMFLFWIYVPLGLVIRVFNELSAKETPKI